MSYYDKNVTCVDCRGFFAFSADDQGLFHELGYDAPKRCRPCRQFREDQRRPYPFGLSRMTAFAPGAPN